MTAYTRGMASPNSLPNLLILTLFSTIEVGCPVAPSLRRHSSRPLSLQRVSRAEIVTMQEDLRRFDASV
jgi:hypothetical protein